MTGAGAGVGPRGRPPFFPTRTRKAMKQENTSKADKCCFVVLRLLVTFVQRMSPSFPRSPKTHRHTVAVQFPPAHSLMVHTHPLSLVHASNRRIRRRRRARVLHHQGLIQVQNRRPAQPLPSRPAAKARALLLRQPRQGAAGERGGDGGDDGADAGGHHEIEGRGAPVELRVADGRGELGADARGLALLLAYVCVFSFWG